MLFRSHIPQDPLSAFIDDFWMYEDYKGGHLREMILPSGTFEMVFNLLEDELRVWAPDEVECQRFSGALISGPYAGPFMSDTRKRQFSVSISSREVHLQSWGCLRESSPTPMSIYGRFGAPQPPRFESACLS